MRENKKLNVKDVYYATSVDKNNNIDSVIVYKSDRLHRSLKNLLITIEDIFIPNNISFIFKDSNLFSQRVSNSLPMPCLLLFLET